ncbi:uncharacterized protein K444DRAFT_539965 [Hyaloscypha bicolor E]|uniref:F-box domain-containing protein n=1 Tax=Hyaloscypha bicolor E TaxID=1095630 RepID=A0A2J6STN1_9HELO|nr:uncharacterized protein K444DRAFT_539965 [Hyaloscypha bicolor E]PMD54134.1 hypothetical protein K444DRAFT_539965 [Hyaloscypha bicolor E]
MNYAKRLFVLFRQRIKRFSRYFAVQRPNSLENSLLAKLPTELLQQIANDLPVASAASFSLSCRHILLLIGTQYLENLATSSHETLVFLKLVEHDLQDQIACNSCRKLHRIKNARKYIGYHHLVEPDCLVDDRKARVYGYIHQKFSSTVFKMAMKHHHLFGYDARSRQLLNLLSVESYTHGWRTLVKKQDAECRIKNGSLFTCKRVAFHGTYTAFERGSIRFFEICPHLELESIGRSASLRITSSYHVSRKRSSRLLHCEKSSNTKEGDLCSELQQCRYCRTEYTAGFEYDDGCTIKLTITIWKDLGQGPEAEEWKAHFPLPDRRSFPQPIQFHGGEIASVFQEKGTDLCPR